MDAEQEALVRELVNREIPTLGVCFGHQVVNSALGDTVEAVGTTATLVEVTLADDPLFDGVDPVVVSLHGDAVTEPGTDMKIIASADQARVFGTRHRVAPLWTVQFHPELTNSHRDDLVDDFGWKSKQFSLEDVTAGQSWKARSNRISMASGSEPNNLLSFQELSEVLPEATDTTPAEIKRGAEAIDIEPPEYADFVSE